MGESYGIILIDNYDDQLRTLAYKRRDTYSYIMLLNGVWGSRNKIVELLKNMTKAERTRLLNYSIDQLWDDLWVDHNLAIYFKKKSKKKYKREEDYIKTMINRLRDKDCHKVMNMWEFPKGKKDYPSENSISCALREFYEETRIPKSHIHIVDNRPITVKHRGTDGRNYINHYYVAATTQPINIPPKTKLVDRIRQETHSGEADCIQFMNIESARNILCDRSIRTLNKAIDVYNGWKMPRNRP